MIHAREVRRGTFERPNGELLMSIRNYKDLLVWQRGIDLAVAAYRCTRTFPPDERYSLTQQIRRAACSIPSNIAEGQGRYHRPEFLHHLSYARGSLQELETELIIAERLEFSFGIAPEIMQGHCDEVSRMLAGLRRSLV
jgi:four helix bundle protein